MELTWFPFSLLPPQRFWCGDGTFYKPPSAKNHNRFIATFWSLVIPTILSFYIFSFISSLEYASDGVDGIARGVTFTCIALLQMYALSHVDTQCSFSYHHDRKSDNYCSRGYIFLW